MVLYKTKTLRSKRSEDFYNVLHITVSILYTLGDMTMNGKTYWLYFSRNLYKYLKLVLGYPYRLGVNQLLYAIV